MKTNAVIEDVMLFEVYARKVQPCSSYRSRRAQAIAKMLIESNVEYL